MMQQQLNGLIDERYEIREEIGGGGMAKVYRAFDTHKRRIVALKYIKPMLAEQADYVRMFEHEARLMKKLRHPNIVRFYEAGTHNGLPYIAMELLEGETLKQLLHRCHTLDPLESLEIILLVTRALQHAHARGVVHCDIKPQNIFIANDGTTKVMDFGVARAGLFRFIAEDGDQLGSAYYLSPEQVSGRYARAASDIYSLGVVFYELVYGQVPFKADTLQATLNMRLTCDLQFPDQPQVPESIRAIIARMMHRDPAQRYQDAGELMADLIRVRQHPETRLVGRKPNLHRPQPTKTPFTPDEMPADYKKIARFTAAILASLVLLVCSGIGISYAVGSSSQDRVKVMLPNLVGLSLSEAQQLADQRGLVLRINESYSAVFKAGLVISQSPEFAANTAVEEASAVDIWISLGPQPILVPQVCGYTLADAKQVLSAMGLIIQVEYGPPVNGEASGIVLNQQPTVGEDAYPGDTITLYISQS